MLLQEIQQPTTHYSSLFANNNENPFLRKKIEFHETWQKHIYTLFVVENSFHEYEFRPQISFTIARKYFVFVKRPPTPANTFHEKVFFAKCSRITTNHSLYTIHISHEFHHFIGFCCPLRIVCSWLIVYFDVQ